MKVEARRIGIDLTPTLPGGVNGGAKPAAMQLVRLLAEAAGREIVVFVRASYFDELPFDDLVNVEVVRVADSFLDAPMPRLSRSGSASMAGAKGVDVLVAPFGDPLLKEEGIPIVPIRYDVQHLDHPEYFSTTELQHRAGADERLVRDSDRIITSSEFSKQRMVELLAIDDGRIDVIPLAAPDHAQSVGAGRSRSRLDQLGVPTGGFLYYPANFWPHKNHTTLLEGYALYRSRATGERVDLVLTGDTLGRADEIRRLAAELGIDSHVHVLGFVDAPTQACIWDACGALIFPSRYEGFGIPLQEAMVHGKPIAASTAASIPEVPGPLAIYFDPTSADDIADACSVVLDPERTRDLTGRYPERLALFTRDAQRQRFLDSIDSASLVNRDGQRERPSDVRLPDAISVIVDLPDAADAWHESTLAHARALADRGAEVVVIATPTGPNDSEAVVAGTGTLKVVWDDTPSDSRALDAALKQTTGDWIMHLTGASEVFSDGLEQLRDAARFTGECDVLHAAAVERDAAPQIVREHPTTWCKPDETGLRHAIAESAVAIRRRALEEIGGFGSGERRNWLACVMARLPRSARFTYVPFFVGVEQVVTSDAALRAPVPGLRNLADAVRELPPAEQAVWLLDRCERVLIERVSTRVETTRMARRVADDLLWFAPYALARCGLEVGRDVIDQGASRWRTVRFAGRTTSLLFAPDDAIAYRPRSPLIDATTPETLAEFTARAFSDPDVLATASPMSVEEAIDNATVDAFSVAIQNALGEEDERRFEISAFEALYARTPRPAELRADDFVVREERLAHTRDMAKEALKAHISRVVANRRRHDFFLGTEQRSSPSLGVAPTNQGITPLGSEEIVTVADWLQRYADARASTTAQHSTPPDSSPRACETGSIPRVTVICSLYRGGAFIDAYLANITSQDRFDECELIIVDAASPEHEYATIERYRQRFPNIDYIRCDERIGIYEAWNIAVERSHGAYLTNANLDDARHCESLRRMADALDDDPDADVVFSDCFYSLVPHVDWDVIAKVGLRTDFPPLTTYSLLEHNAPHCAPMWRRTLHDRFGLFDSTFQSAGDWEFWLRCARGGARFLKIDPVLVTYFQNPNGISTRADSVSRSEQDEIRRRYRDLLIEPDRPITTAAGLGDLAT